MNHPPSSDQTLDAFLNGGLKVLQSKKGYRFSIDAVLLSEFVEIKKHERVIDLGTGCGILPLLLSRTKARSFVGVEVQKELAELAQENVSLNHLQDRITILHRDYRELKEVFPSGSFDVVLSNPPYRKYRTGRMNPSIEKALARHEIRGTVENLIAIASYLLPPKGRCYLIFPAMRTIDLMLSLRRERLEPKRMQFVYSRAEEKATFVLTESVMTGGAEVTVLPPRFLHGRQHPCEAKHFSAKKSFDNGG